MDYRVHSAFCVVLSLAITVYILAKAVTPGMAAGEPFSTDVDEPYLLPQVWSADRSFCVEMLGQIELLTAIQSQTTWMKTSGPKDGPGNDYFQAVNEFMRQYEDHEAVRVCQALLDREWSFSYDAPVLMALHWGPLPDLELVHEYSDYLVRRAGGRENLEEFRMAMKSFVQDSGYLSFLEKWRPAFQRWVNRVAAMSGLQETREWLEEFFGEKAGEFHLVLSPASFYSSYGPRISTPDRGLVAYCVACAYPSGGDPYFGSSLERLCRHEFGHSFVNPALDQFLALTDLQKFEPLFRPVRKQMQSQAYGDLHTFILEQVLRAAECLAAKDLDGNDAYESEIKYNEDRGFYLTQYLVGRLEEYAQNRDRYPKFRDYVPTLLEHLESCAEEAAARKRRSYTALSVIFGMALIAGGIAIVRGLRKKRSAAS